MKLYEPDQDLVLTYDGLAFCRNYHGSDPFSASFLAPSPHIHQSIHWSCIDFFLYMATVAIVSTKLPFCCNNGPDHYSINASVRWLFTSLLCQMRAPTRKHVWSTIQSCLCAGSFVRTLHSCWTQLHRMPSANPIILISHPIPGPFSKRKKKENGFQACSSALSRTRTDIWTFTSSLFWLPSSGVDVDLLLG